MKGANMAKKRKRQRRSSSSTTFATRREVEFNPDYTPIKQDLKRIGTLAGTFFLILVVLSFFLR